MEVIQSSTTKNSVGAEQITECKYYYLKDINHPCHLGVDENPMSLLL
jgi:hypothetical protein